MKQEKFEALVRSLEPFAKREPRSYQIRVAFLAALGYVYRKSRKAPEFIHGDIRLHAILMA